MNERAGMLAGLGLGATAYRSGTLPQTLLGRAGKAFVVNLALVW